GDREYDYTHATLYSTGGSLVGGKVTSLWGQRMTTTFLCAYNNKGGSDASTFADYNGSGPDTIIHAGAFANGARIVGTGRLVEGGNLEGNGPGGPGGSESLSPSSLWTIRGDLTYFKDDLAGSHEFQTGFYGAPLSKYDTEHLHQQRIHPRGALDGGSERRREGHGAVPPAVCRHDRHQDTPGARPRLRVLRPGQLETDWTADGHGRYPVRLRQARRRALQCGARKRSYHPAAARLLVSGDPRRAQRAARQLCARRRADDGPRRSDDVRRECARRHARRLRRQPRSEDRLDDSHAGQYGGSGGEPVRARPAPALRRRVHPRLPQAAAVFVRHRRRRYSPRLQRHLCELRDQRILAERPQPAVRRLRSYRSEPGERVPGAQQHLEPVELHGARNHAHQKPVARVPVHGGDQPAVAAHQRRLESARSGEVHPAVCIRQREVALHAARQQRREQSAVDDWHHGSHLRSDVAEIPPELRQHLS